MKFLIIQTAFLGDVALATPIIEKLRKFYPTAEIDFLLRKGNEGLLEGHPHLRKVLIWDKKDGKLRNQWQIIQQIRQEQYDWVVNCQRYFSSGIFTILSGARQTAGFDKNPLSRFFSKKIKHQFGSAAAPLHEIERNLQLIEHLTDAGWEAPRLYPSKTDFMQVLRFLPQNNTSYYTIAPTSVWFTKQLPAAKWIELIQRLPEGRPVFLLGAPTDVAACAEILEKSGRSLVENLCGKLSLLQSAALMQNATMNFVNDSAPMHLASAMNAPVTAFFCSTVPRFGFTPVSEKKQIVEVKRALPCRPCGLHGYTQCPKGHFACAHEIEIKTLMIE